MLNSIRSRLWLTAAITASTCGALLAQEASDPAAASAVLPSAAVAAAEKTAEAVDAEKAAEKALNARVGAIRFDAAPAADALQFLADQAGVDLVVDPRLHADEDFSGFAITLDVSRGKISARTALEIVLEQISPEVTYTIRDGLVYITRESDAATVVVYDCRDLLERTPRASTTAASVEALVPAAAAPRSHELFAGNADELIQVLTSTVAPDSWSDAGGFGTVTSYRGLVVVKQSPSVHRELRELLASLRSAMHR